MADNFLGEIRLLPFNFPPEGWAFCNGQLLPISDYTGLFSLLGTTYGGDGIDTFGLPNLQGTVAIHQGQGAGLSLRDLGETGGEQDIILKTSEIPAHTHALQAQNGPAQSLSPQGNLSATLPGGRFPSKLYTSTAKKTVMLAGGVLPAGGDQPHNNMAPYLVLNYAISLVGIFPSRP